MCKIKITVIDKDLDRTATSGWLYKLRKTRLDLSSNEPNLNATTPTERKMTIMRCNNKILSFSFLFIYLHRYRSKSVPIQLTQLPQFTDSAAQIYSLQTSQLTRSFKIIG